MLHRIALSAALLLPLVAIACGGGDTGGAAGGPAGGLPCDVDAVLARSCRSCHAEAPKFGAPMPLVSLADLQAAAPSDPSRKVYELVAERIHDDARPMPPPPNARLGADEATIDAWSRPAPAGPTRGGGGGGGGAAAPRCTPTWCSSRRPAMPQAETDI
jgi:hypothetical protein